MSKPTYAWLTTTPKPGGSFLLSNTQTTGWKRHALKDVPESDSFEDVRHMSSVCGLRARYGWDMDLYIEDKCARCETIVAKQLAA